MKKLKTGMKVHLEAGKGQLTILDQGEAEEESKEDDGGTERGEQEEKVDADKDFSRVEDAEDRPKDLEDDEDSAKLDKFEVEM